MCLAIPMKIVRVEGDFAWVAVGAFTRKINIQMVPVAKKGDYVLVHAGFAIEKVNPRSAKETLKIFAS